MQGFFGLYKGVTPTILKQGSNQAIRFTVMETLRDWYTNGDRNSSVPKPVVALFGAIAGGCSVLGNQLEFKMDHTSVRGSVSKK